MCAYTNIHLWVLLENKPYAWNLEIFWNHKFSSLLQHLCLDGVELWQKFALQLHIYANKTTCVCPLFKYAITYSYTVCGHMCVYTHNSIKKKRNTGGREWGHRCHWLIKRIVLIRKSMEMLVKQKIFFLFSPVVSL